MSLAPGEDPVIAVHQHWKVLVGPMAAAVLIVVAALVAALSIPFGKDAPVGELILVVLAVVAVAWVVGMPLLRWRTTTYELTSRRLRMRTGIIAREGKDLPLSRITDVSFETGLLDRIFGCGTLVVESPGERGQVRLTEIPHIQYVQSALFQLVEEERRRTVVRGEDPGM
jgi:uncharacterized membrane protein YdbT with pleckstrin-like domain